LRTALGVGSKGLLDKGLTWGLSLAVEGLLREEHPAASSGMLMRPRPRPLEEIRRMEKEFSVAEIAELAMAIF